MATKKKPAPKKGGRKPTLDPELVAAALTANDGNVSAVARRFGVARASVQEMIAKSDSLKQVLIDAREGMLDEGENSLYCAVRNGEAWAVCFFLKTQGKGRGYVERQELTGKDGEKLAAVTFIETPAAADPALAPAADPTPTIEVAGDPPAASAD